ncbi:serine/threonine-protein kinase [Streptomyces sp. NPDC005963]|uniref:serine/threonine-protein kinase n=1 Tax=Streptomyces sp. NPDC005963 TaxID=3156721 RepID=UPI003403FF3E
MSTWSVPGYTDVRELGSGASGRVVQAVHETTGTPVAIKYLSERLRSNPSFVQGFRAEARLLGGLDSPHVVRLYEYVESPLGAAIVMELVDGIALRALLRNEGATTGPEAALVVLKGSLLGLAAAHRTGVVHRDYKPDNVLVAADGSSKLVDFGIAVDHGSTVEVAGTPAYMAPEQWQGEPASPAGDVYAATATFYECLTGHKPYSGQNFAELALQHIDAPVPDEDAPEAVRPLIRRGLAKSPEDRPANAAVFVAELESIAQAAYGPHWEERGQRKLAALAALLPLLFPSAAGGAEGTTELATTAIRQPDPAAGGGGPDHGGGIGSGLRGALPSAVALAVALAVLVGLLALAVVRESAGSDPARVSAQSVATTSASPQPPSAAPTSEAEGSDPPEPSSSSPDDPSLPGDPSALPTPSPSPSVPPEPSASDTVTPSTSPSSSEPVVSPSASQPPSSRPSPSASAAPPVRVRSVSVDAFQQRRRAPVADAAVSVVTDGTGPVTVVVTWYTSDAPGDLGIAEGSESFTLSGAREYGLTPSHDFQGAGCYLGVRATTQPNASGGESTRQITRGCALQ